MNPKGEMTKMVREQLPADSAQQMMQAMAQMAQGINDLALMLRVTNERMDALEKEVRRLTKVTPAQAAAINQEIRMRAELLGKQHRAEGFEKPIANAIRKSLKLGCGISSVRELPRSDYSLAMQRIQMWDDYRLIRDLKAKEASRRG